MRSHFVIVIVIFSATEIATETVIENVQVAMPLLTHRSREQGS